MTIAPGVGGSMSDTKQPQAGRLRYRLLFAVGTALVVSVALLGSDLTVFPATAQAQAGKWEGSGAATRLGSATSTQPLDALTLAAVDDIGGRLTSRDAQVTELETRLGTLEEERGFGDRFGPVTSFQITWALLLVGGIGMAVAASRSGNSGKR